MRLSFKQLKKMPVRTMSDALLGKVSDIIFDTNGQEIIQYEVRSSSIGGEVYLISRDQVARFEDKKMVVYDTAIKKKEKQAESFPTVIASGVATSQDTVS